MIVMERWEAYLKDLVQSLMEEYRRTFINLIGMSIPKLVMYMVEVMMGKQDQD